MPSVSGASAPVKLEAAERRAVAAMAATLSLRMFGLFVLLPVLALYASELPGATALTTGLAVGIFGIAQAALQIPAGLLSDRIGRKAVIVFGLVVFALGSVVAAESTTIAGLLWGRILQGAGAISAAATALVADLTRAAVRTRAMAVIGIAIGSTFILALALGPQLAAWVGVPGLFLLVAGAAVLASLIVIVGPGDFSRPAVRTRLDMRAALFNPGLLGLYAGIFVLHAMLTATFVALPFVLRDTIGLVAGQHTSVYLAAMLASLIGTVPLVLAIERARRPLMIVAIGLALIALGQGALGLSNSLAAVVVALALFFAGFNFLEARLPARVSQVAGDAVRGAALGAFATGQYLGAFAGGLIGGALLGWRAAPAVFAVGATAAGTWMLITMLAFSAGKKKPLTADGEGSARSRPGK